MVSKIVETKINLCFYYKLVETRLVICLNGSIPVTRALCFLPVSVFSVGVGNVWRHYLVIHNKKRDEAAVLIGEFYSVPRQYRPDDVLKTLNDVVRST